MAAGTLQQTTIITMVFEFYWQQAHMVTMMLKALGTCMKGGPFVSPFRPAIVHFVIMDAAKKCSEKQFAKSSLKLADGLVCASFFSNHCFQGCFDVSCVIHRTRDFEPRFSSASDHEAAP